MHCIGAQFGEIVSSNEHGAHLNLQTTRFTLPRTSQCSGRFNAFNDQIRGDMRDAAHYSPHYRGLHYQTASMRMCDPAHFYGYHSCFHPIHISTALLSCCVPTSNARKMGARHPPYLAASPPLSLRRHIEMGWHSFRSGGISLLDRATESETASYFVFYSNSTFAFAY